MLWGFDSHKQLNYFLQKWNQILGFFVLIKNFFKNTNWDFIAHKLPQKIIPNSSNQIHIVGVVQQRRFAHSANYLEFFADFRRYLRETLPY